VIGTARTSRATLRSIAIWLGVLAIGTAGILLAGCGSGDEATSATERTSAEAAAPDSGGEGPERKSGPSRAPADRDGGQSGKSNKSGKEAGHGQATDPGSADTPGEGGSTSARREKAERKLKEHCPPDADKASCEALVEGFLASKGKSTGSAVNEPSDCTQAMSEEECERTLKAQKASEGNYSVDVEECLADPTPRCEEVLRPLFEQQQAAEASGG
jgi:hypothetical protein